MDAHRFDDLTRTLATSSRRRFLAGVAAAVGGALVARPTAAACPPDQIHRRGMGCVCKATGRPPQASGSCPCPNGKARCDGFCVDPMTDVAHCGGCGMVCDDGDACTADSCAAGRCRHAPISCVAGDACTEAHCDPAVGCVFSPISCPDDDGDACTAAACDPAVGCVSLPRSCDDDDVCTTDTCDPATGCVHTPIVCDDGDPCTVNGCDPVTGCTFTPVADGLAGACQAGSICCGGACKLDGGQECALDADCCDEATCVPTGGERGVC